MHRNTAAHRIREKKKKHRLKRDYLFKQALLSANLNNVKEVLKKNKIPYSSDDYVILQTAKSITASIKDRPAVLVYAAIEKYNEQLKLLDSTKNFVSETDK